MSDETQRLWESVGDNALICRFLPEDDSWQASSIREVAHVLSRYRVEAQSVRVLDLGCGNGDSYGALIRCRQGMRWVGLDIDSSPEVKLRRRVDLEFHTYDGVHIPFAGASFDIVYSRQVFEHVAHPEDLLHEVYRVLGPGGILVGSTSQLEPFHSRSLWNYTPYGFAELLMRAGFNTIVIRPGIDGLTLLLRRICGMLRLARPFNMFFERESPLNLLIELSARLLRIRVKRRNAIKLLFAGQFTFEATKGAGVS